MSPYHLVPDDDLGDEQCLFRLLFPDGDDGFVEEPCDLELFHVGKCWARCTALHPAGWALAGAQCVLEYRHKCDHEADPKEETT